MKMRYQRADVFDKAVAEANSLRKERDALAEEVGALRDALQHMLDNCPLCDGLGYRNQPHGSHLTYEDCAYCMKARKALVGDGGGI